MLPENLAYEIPIALGLAFLALRLSCLPWGQHRRPVTTLPHDERATATLDFVLVFPTFTIVVLVLVQLALLINARLVVSYAAFVASRSAIVWLEEGEEIALERAQRAAEIGCLPISPAILPSGLGLGNTLTVTALYLHGGASDIGRRALRGGSKLQYSKLTTSVELLLPDDPLGPFDPVTVEVEHRFYLSVPYGDRVFQEPHPGPAGLPFRTIRDRFTLTHEGRVQSR